jgi:hypothetical protein
MTRIIIDDAFQSQLGQFRVPIELCDRAGRTLGHFLPQGLSWQEVLAGDNCPYSHEELIHMQQESGGRALSEIWQSVGRK